MTARWKATMMRDRTMRPGLRRLGGITGTLAFVLMTMVIPGTAPVATAASGTAAPCSGGGAASECETVTDPHGSDTGGPQTYNMQVDVSQTTNLQPRQNISLSWRGFAPTRNYDVTGNAAGTNLDEYPVVLVQCWGLETDANFGPSHCFSGSATYGIPPHVSNPVYNDTNTQATPNPPKAPGIFPIFGSWLGFTDVHGTLWGMNNNKTTPVDLSATSLSPPNSQIAFTASDGSRTNAQFEVRTSDQYPSLGCSDKRACTLVVVPILHPACLAQPSSSDCTGKPYNAVGPASGTNSNSYLGAATWWLTSQWTHRFSFPLTFAQQPNECNVADTRPQVPVAGSELAFPEMYSWVPGFCADPKKFNMEYVATSEPQARQLLTTSNGAAGYGANAALTSLPVANSPRPVVHAPVAVTGFAITYLIDDGKHQEVRNLRLTPLLLAKLITDSYPGGRISEPVLEGNPATLFTDPNFLAVNPGFTISNDVQPSDMNLIMFGAGDQSDVIWGLTSYVTANQEARAWLDGAPDNYSGMVVNPAYQGLALPELTTQILDQYREPVTNPSLGPCETSDPSPDQIVFSQPVNNMQAAAFAELNGQSPATSLCNLSGVGAGLVASWGRTSPQAVGSRDLIALTSVPFADEYGLPMAQLQTQVVNGQPKFAGATPDSMTAAMASINQDKATGVASLNFAHLSPAAYPGTMAVYAAVPTHGLDHTAAQQYAQLLTYAATDGQTPGFGIGQLPAGYASLTSEALSSFAQYTLQVAHDVATQDGQVPLPPPNLGQQVGQTLGVTPFNGSGGNHGGGGTGGSNPSDTGSATNTNGSSAGGHGSTSGTNSPTGQPQTVALTRSSSSWLGEWGLPILLGVGVLAGLLVPFVRVAAQPGHPVRVALFGCGTTVARWLSRRS